MMQPTIAAGRRIDRFSGPVYEAAALILVVIYVNTFGMWQALATSFGQRGAGMVPVALTALVGGAVVIMAYRRARRRQPIGWAALLFAGGLAAVGLLLSDPAFPAKRVHVAQYMLLALIVVQALKRHLGGAPLLVAATFATAVLGSHDELLQGLYPDRTFGLRDLGVNALSGLAGVLLASAFGLSSASAAVSDWRLVLRQLDGPEWLALLILTIGWLLLLAAVPGLRGPVFPFWPLAPLAAGGVAWAVASSAERLTGARHVMARLGVLLLSTILYPLSTHALPLALH